MDGEAAAGPTGLPRTLDGRSPGARPLGDLGTDRLTALDALLRDIDGLRLALETDLSLVAGAVEAEAPALASVLLEGERRELAAFEQRALAHLRAMEDAERREQAPLAAPLPAPVVALAPVRRRRLSRLLPAAPLVAAAAALVGLLGVVPSTTVRPAPADVSGAVLSSWAELERLTATDAPPLEVERAALDLHADIVSMVARAEGDPETARRALEVLREAQVVLAADDDAEALQGVLRQTRVLAARLLATLPPAVRRIRVPEVLSTPALVRLPTPRPVVRRSQTPDSRRTAGPQRSSRPFVQQSPAPRSAGPSPTPSSLPSGSASPTPSSTARPPLLPGPFEERPDGPLAGRSDLLQ